MANKETEKILKQGRDRFRSGRRADKSERLLAEEDIRFAINDDGCQWPKEVRKIREGAVPSRPCLVMNKIPEKIDQAEGEFRQLRPAIKISAVDSNADPKIAEIFSGIIRHIEYNSMARSAYTTAYSNILHCGRGFWRYDIVESEDDPFENDIIVNRVPNALSSTWDPASKKIDKSDANWWFLHDDIDVKEFEAEYPNVTLESWPDDESYQGWKREDTIRVAEYWWKEKGTKTAYRVDRGGTIITVWKKEKGDKLIKEKQVNHPKVRWCKMVATQIIDGPHDDWPGRYIPIIPVFGKETNINGVAKSRGMVRFGKEPQRMYNYWTSAEAEQITTMPKAPYLMTPAMMGPHQAQWDLANIKNFSWLFYELDPKNPGARPVKEAPPQMSTAMVSAKQSMEHDIMSGMNVYRASIGDQGSETSGVAINARKQQGSIGGYSYVDNFEYALTHGGRVLLDIIPHVYPSERILRIRGDGGKESLIVVNARPDSPLIDKPGVDKERMVQTQISAYINDITIGKYDVAVALGSSYTTQREAALDKLIKVLELMPELAAVSGDLVVGLLDMPMSDELLSRAKKLIPTEIRGLDPDEEPPQPEPPSPEQQQAAQELDMKTKELQLKGIEEMRKGFTAEMDAIAKIMTAEAKEAGQQFTEVMGVVSSFKEREQLRQQEQQAQQQARQQQAQQQQAQGGL